jgi:hypothetical protein
VVAKVRVIVALHLVPVTPAEKGRTNADVVPVHPPFSPGQIDRHLATVADSADLLVEEPEMEKSGVVLTVNIDMCIRCRAAHEQLGFRRYVYENTASTELWSICPETAEPIWLNVEFS